MGRDGLATCLLTLVACTTAFAETPPSRSPAAAYLARWADSSVNAVNADLDQYVERYGEKYPHEILRYLAAFFGPVDAPALQQAFRWSVMEESESEVRLRAMPKALDRLAERASVLPSSSSETISLAAPVSPGRGDHIHDQLAFDIVFDIQFPGPRMVRWLAPEVDGSREAVERLLPQEQPLGPHRAGRGIDAACMSAPRVQQASAISLNADLAPGGVDPAVLEILSRWEQASSELKSVDIAFKRFDRDNVFEVESRGVGRFIFVTPNRGLYLLRPAPVVDRAEGPAAASGGKFAVTSAKSQLYWWNGENVVIVDQREKTYDTLPIPRRIREEIQTVGSWDVIWQVFAGPQKALPAVVDLKAEKMLNRFEWTVLENSETRIHLRGQPRAMQDRRHFKLLGVVPDPKTFRTMGTQLVDPSGHHETIHFFEYSQVNAPTLQDLDSWKPDLLGLSPVGPLPLAPAAEDLPGVPPSQ